MQYNKHRVIGLILYKHTYFDSLKIRWSFYNKNENGASRQADKLSTGTLQTLLEKDSIGRATLSLFYSYKKWLYVSFLHGLIDDNQELLD